MKTNQITKINGSSIIVIEDDGKKYVAIKPICEALGIDYSNQLKKIKDDEVLVSTMVLKTTVWGDNKNREMQCIPYALVFGWLFTINPKNVDESAKEAVSKYRMECYYALFQHFTDMEEYLDIKNQMIEDKAERLEVIKKQFSSAKNDLKIAEMNLNKLVNIHLKISKQDN